MLRDIIYRLSEWYRVNRRIIYFFLIILFLSRFLYLNYINWTKGELCSGHGGIQYGMDSMRFLHGADKIINHQDFADCEENYMGYAFVIAFVKISGLDLSFVLIIQLIFALLSSLALYDLGKSITKSKTIGLLSAGLYLINPFITQWHLYIHTESFYSSMLVISTWSIYKAVKNNNLKFYVLSLIIIFYTALIRPNGMVTVPIFFFFVIITRKINSRIKIISVISVIITFLFLI
ncbi:MAG: glycosyltransferase family 39 protein, partial [Bacteroidales bacterium]